MGKLTLHGVKGSPPVRAVLLTLEALKLPYDFVEVNLFTKEHLTKEFLAKNPQHTVPVLDDGGDYIWDSHAIMAYLVRKYGKNDSLYPKDFLKRARVDQRLHYESSAIFTGALRNITAPLFFHNETHVPKSKVNALVEVYNLLEIFLKDNNYMVGDTLTIADFSIVSSVTSLVGILDIDAGKYPKLTAWIKRLEQLPYYQEANAVGAKLLFDMIKSKNLTLEQ